LRYPFQGKVILEYPTDGVPLVISDRSGTYVTWYQLELADHDPTFRVPCIFALMIYGSTQNSTTLRVPPFLFACHFDTAIPKRSTVAWRDTETRQFGSRKILEKLKSPTNGVLWNSFGAITLIVSNLKNIDPVSSKTPKERSREKADTCGTLRHLGYFANTEGVPSLRL
jgi:hypothetical protein